MTATTALTEPDLAPPAAGRRNPGRVLDRIRRAPLTTALLAVLWAVGAATGSITAGPPQRLVEQVGVGIGTLDAGRWWAPATSLLWCSGLAAYLVTSLLLAVVGPPAEHRLGTGRTAAVLLGTQVLGTVLGTGVVRLGVAAGLDWTTVAQDQTAVGPAVGLCGLASVLSFRLNTLWRRRLRLLVLLVPLVMLLYVGHLQSAQRVLAVVSGLLVGLALHRPRQVPRAPHASSGEVRVLVALCLAATAFGPLVASLYPDATGPFNSFGELYFSHVPSADEVAELCAYSVEDCARAYSTVRFLHSPGLLMAALVPLLLVVLAQGLRRGLRAAWRVTALTELLWTGILAWQLAANYRDFASTGDTLLLLAAVGQALLLPLAVLALLLATRRRFPHRLGRPETLRLVRVIGGALLLSCTAYVGTGLLVRDQYQPDATLGRLLAGLPSELLPPAYGDLLPGRPIAIGWTTQALEICCGVLFWTVALIALVSAFRRPVLHAQPQEAARARELLTTHGGSTLSFITTWAGNHYWFTPDGRAAVAYRVLGGVALTTGDPFGDPAARPAAVGGFAAHCDARGWTPCFYSCTEPTLRAARALGWRSLQVAEDTVVPLAELAFSGRKWQDIRTALNKAARQGITAEWWSYRDAPIGLRDQLRSISEEWVSDKGLPEMGFTLGGIDELADPAVRLLVAVDGDRTVHGVTSWMPVYEDGRPVGWTLDFMRRRSEGFRGVSEFLIASAALGFQAEGARFLSLSGAPLARADRGEPPTTLQRTLDRLGELLEPVYGFRSLLAFKAKFQPDYRPMYLLYPDPAALPAVSRAVGKAYLPDLTPAQGVRLLRRLRTRTHDV